MSGRKDLDSLIERAAPVEPATPRILFADKDEPQTAPLAGGSSVAARLLDLQKLQAPADLNAVEKSLRDLAIALASADLLTIETTREQSIAAFGRLGVKPAVARSLVSAAFVALGKSTATTKPATGGSALSFPAPEPWPEPVTGDQLLGELVGVIETYLALSRSEAVAISLWILHAWTFDAGPISPRLAILSPTKKCGKSTLLRILQRLCPRSLNTSNISMAALFRTVEAHRPTLLVDEADSFLTLSNELRGIINSGHERTGTVVRSVGDTFEPRAFSTFCATAIAAIGRLPGTIEDRSIKVNMRRRTKGELVTRFRSDQTGALDQIARRAARWAADTAACLGDADPAVPPGLDDDRAVDNWRPLLAIADEAGGEWPMVAREAALKISGAADDSSDSLGELLLADCRVLLADDRDTISSVDLCAELINLEDRPWGEVNRGKQINPHRLGKLLRPFSVTSRMVRFGSTTSRVYRREEFSDAFRRYPAGQKCPTSPNTTSQAKHRNNSIGTGVSGVFGSETKEECFTCESGSKPNTDAGCVDVSLAGAGTEGEARSWPLAEPIREAFQDDLRDDWPAAPKAQPDLFAPAADPDPEDLEL